ncbi:hypothetical protein [Sphingomonas sp.]|uniref:hypothetical protein n=1 Tax=Sphingomonas sp. TaxID=28214 RepID=UPI0025E9E227|nr:hypothetical protein [Sphingomonas sp.]
MDVKLGRKEAKRQRTAREQQTYFQQKSASRQRNAVVSDFTEFTRLFEEEGLPVADDLTSFIDRLIIEYREGSGERSDHDLLIFDPGLTDLSTLPIGVLDHKELALPDALIPRSRDDLLSLCECMIVRSRDRELIAYVVAGWPDCTVSRRDIRNGSSDAIDAAIAYLHRHVDRLWHLYGSAPAMYEAIVAGRHGHALKRLRNKGAPGNFSREIIFDLIARQGLIWCCNDLQLTFARSRIAAANPFGALVSAGQIELKPERITNDFKPYLLLLRVALQLYATLREEHDPVRPKAVPEGLPDNPQARLLGAAVKHDLDLLVLGLGLDRTPLDSLVERIRSLQTYGNKRLWRILDRPLTQNELTAHFSGIWFAGLSHVQIAGVGVLRYLQAEAYIEHMVQEWYPQKGTSRAIPRDGIAMPPFDANYLGAAWNGHAKDLLHLYRRETLRDKMAPEPGVSLTHRSKNAGDASLDIACAFLSGRSQRRIGDHAGHINSVERTFYLIDIIPEARLARG